MTSGDIFFTPPAYVCDIQKTFSAEHEAAYKAKENIPFRKTLDGLVVKSQLSCDQADALCTVNKFFEKVRRNSTWTSFILDGRRYITVEIGMILQIPISIALYSNILIEIRPINC